MLKNVMGKGAALSALAVLAACASTTPVTDTTPTVRPVAEAAPVVRGPTPGSQADLDQNVGQRVFFGYNQYNLTNEAQATLRRQAAWLQEYPGARIRVEGHCDERGTRDFNLALGARRANAAKAYLIGLGVDASRISVLSHGKERPIDPRSTPDAWAVNRNASTVVLTSIGS